MKGVITQISIVVFLGFVSSTLSAKCPKESAIDPCICERGSDSDLSLSCYDGNTLKKLRKVLSYFDKKSTLSVELSQMSFKVLPSDIFEGFKVKKLEISQGSMERLSEKGKKPLSGLEDILEELVISSSFTEDNGPIKLDFSHLRNLKTLDLSYNVITKVGNDWFENGPKSLTHLVLSNNGIEELGDQAFVNLDNLKSLWLDGNRFGPIKRSILPSLASQLTDFQLDNNALTSLPDDIFEKMPQLKQISLKTNGLTTISQKALEPVWEQLESLDMRGNSIICDSSLEWMSRQRSLVSVLGTCASPPEQEGVDLKDFISKGKTV